MPSKSLLAIGIAALLAVACSSATLADDQSGLTPAEQQEFFHTPEGSETVPLAWMQALHNPDGSLFMQNLGRFGLLTDPDKKQHLPIGLTVARTRDLNFMKLDMVGVNCAACHTGEFHYKGTAVRVIGAPGRFDLIRFYSELSQAIDYTLHDWGRAYQFLRDINSIPAAAVTASTSAHPNPLNSVHMSGSVDFLNDEIAIPSSSLPTASLPPDESTAILAGLRAVLEDESTRTPDDPTKTFERAPDADSRTNNSNSIPDLSNLKRLTSMVADVQIRDEPFSLSTSTTHYTAAIGSHSSSGNIFDRVRITFRLLFARAAFLYNRKDGDGSLPPGSGRIDAFDNARNELFPNFKIAANSPVSYPHLWGLNFAQWLHWDGNTNSVMERNLGQALGLGAIFEDGGYHSTLRPRDIGRLEDLARKIKSPVWPACFGGIDKEKARKGERIYQQNCAGCHAATINGSPSFFEDPNVATDPYRASNFDKPLGAQKFSDAIASTLSAIKKTAYADDNIGDAEQQTLNHKVVPIWRDTGHYFARPLTGVWATAPYLHNNSVPTLSDLLLPADQRPKHFTLHTEYEPHLIGISYDTVQVNGGTFDTTIQCNSNEGHTGKAYGTELSKDERNWLLEYLKTI